jgi:hypothetical protein
MRSTSQSPIPFCIKLVIALLLTKAVLPIIGEIIPRIVVAEPIPFTWGSLSFLLPAVLLPIVIAVALLRAPAAGFWATVIYAAFAAVVSGLVILAPQIASAWSTSIPVPDPYASARAFEHIWRLVSIGTSILVLLSVIRPVVIRWVNSREDALRMMLFPSRRTTTISTRAVWILPLVAGATVPTLIWVIAQRFVGGIHLGDAIMDILLEHLKGRALMLDIFSMLPYVVLAVTAYKNARRMSSVTLWSVTLGGLVGIMALMVPLYYVGWETTYNEIRGDEKTTGVMIFFFTPLYCIATMLAGMLLGWVTTRLFRKGVDDLIEDHT